jgi:soluble lytic murein transglycosylase
MLSYMGHSRSARRGPARRRYGSWTLLACLGVACGQLLGMDPNQPSAPRAEAGPTNDNSSDAAHDGARTAPAAFALVTTAGSGAGPAAPAKAPPLPPPPAVEDSGADDDVDENRRAPELQNALNKSFTRAGPNFPGQTWRDAVNSADWPNAAALIDALPEAEQQKPGTRYARALAARELGQHALALRLLDGLESSLPLLHDEIQAARAHCQIEVGPHEAAYQYFTREQSPDNLILAARACANGGDLARSHQTVEKALQKIRNQGETKRGRASEIKARALRARLLETRGDVKLAARDWLWLATVEPNDAVSENADETYERLSGERLTKAQRFERMRTFSLDGNLDRALRERSQLAAAPGSAPDELEVTISLAWAYYHSRRDYLKAADLFRQASEKASGLRAKYMFYEARALSRADRDLEAIDKYAELVRRFPDAGYTEQAHYRIARLHYGLGHWEKAVVAYSQYLERYAKGGGGKYGSASRYELAISRLGAKQRTEEAAVTLAQFAKKERRPERRAMYTHLEGVALETTRDPRKLLEAIRRYRSVIEELPLSFAALSSAARLRGLGREGVLRERLTGSFGKEVDAEAARAHQLPEKAQLLADIGLHTDAERALFEQRAEVRRRYAENDDQALCELYGSLDRGYRSYSFADRLFRSEELESAPSASNLWAWRCAYPRPYRDIVDAVEERYKLPEWLVYSVMRQESGFRPNVVSPVGAVGLMQLMPTTALRAAEEITEQPGAPWVPDPKRPTNVLDNVEMGGFYLGKLLALLGGQLPVAVAAYNAGPSAVSRWLDAGQDLPADVWVARIPYTETRDYVSYVLGNWVAYRYLDDPTDLPELELALGPASSAAAQAY